MLISLVGDWGSYQRGYSEGYVQQSMIRLESAEHPVVFHLNEGIQFRLYLDLRTIKDNKMVKLFSVSPVKPRVCFWDRKLYSICVQ